MNRDQLLNWVHNYVQTSPRNQVAEEEAISTKDIGLSFYDLPIMGVARANDPFFLRLQEPQAIGPHFLLPKQWLPSAKTVISFFFPFTRRIKEANAREAPSVPAAEWLYARVEGQQFLELLGKDLRKYLKKQGIQAIVPSLDPRFWSRTLPKEDGQAAFTSNWSERHIAFACSLGTFGLSKGIITSLGMAGRLFSVITDLDITEDVRPYVDIYEYCIHCGACIKNCPAGAISEQGKNHILCSAFLNKTRKEYAPRYGCGKCQTGVPCESKNPRSFQKNDNIFPFSL